MFDEMTTFKANELDGGVLEFMFAHIRDVGDDVFLAHQDGEFHCFHVSLDDAECKQKVVTLNTWDFLGDFLEMKSGDVEFYAPVRISCDYDLGAIVKIYTQNKCFIGEHPTDIRIAAARALVARYFGETFIIQLVDYDMYLEKKNLCLTQ